MLIIVPLLAFICVALLILAFGNSNLDAVEDRLHKYGYISRGIASRDLSRPFSERIILPILRGLGKVGAALTPRNLKEDVEERLARAGNPYGLKANAFLTISLVLGAFLPVAFLVAVEATGKPIELKHGLLALLLLVIAGYVFPKLWLGMKITARQKEIERRLPDALDLITICVEAGLALEAALARVVARQKGPLGDEFGRALQEISVGKARARALRDVSKRAGVADLQSVIAAIVQAEEMGTSIANVLRVQSDSVRVKRQQRAQEQAMKAPVKMLFPLVFCILPAMFVVILGPAAIRISQALLKS